jgi:hypothetical protein
MYVPFFSAQQHKYMLNFECLVVLSRKVDLREYHDDHHTAHPLVVVRSLPPLRVCTIYIGDEKGRLSAHLP